MTLQLSKKMLWMRMNCAFLKFTLLAVLDLPIEIFCNSEFPKIPYVLHYEPVYYDHYQLRNHHVSKRSSGGGISFTFEAFGRSFTPVLFEDSTHLHSALTIETSKGNYHRRPITLSGFVKEDNSKVQGILTDDGIFEGMIISRNETFYINKATEKIKSDLNFHTVIYKGSDVIFNSSKASCAHAQIKEKPNRMTEAMETYGRYNYTSEDIKGAKYKAEFNDEFWQQRKQRAKRDIDPSKTICELYMQADHLFYQKYGSNVDTVIGKLTQYVQAVDSIYKSINFDGVGGPDNIGFIIKKIKIWDDPTVPGYKYTGNLAVDYFLDLHSKDNYDLFCLSYLLTYREFSDGVLGLAWVGHSSSTSAGGVCEIYRTYQGEGKSLNTGIVTVLNYGIEIPNAVAYTTLAHEIGHNFGSEHDPEGSAECAPGAADGNYIMFARATSGDKPNNFKFSTCSISQMQPVLEAKARGTDGCFVAFHGEICGNRVVEGSEECDCGWEEECTEGCCNPQVLNLTGVEKPCTRKSTSVCSPSEGECCTNSCQFAPSTQLCRPESDCLDEAHCSGTDSTCTKSGHKNNTVKCGSINDDMVCYNGECTGSICLAHGREPCYCSSSSGSWKDAILCQVCCKDGNFCKSSYDLADVPDAEVLAGTPCNNYQGYCDIFKICRKVDPEGPLSNLRKLFSSEGILNTVKKFLTVHWYVGVIAGVVFIITIALVVKFCSKSHKPPDKTVEDSPHSNPGNRTRLSLRMRNQVAPDGYI